MAHGRKTGGRDFKKGEGGRKKGAKDKVPRGLKAKIAGSICSMYEALLRAEPELFEQRIRSDLKYGTGAVGFQHVQLAAYYLDGKPVDRVEVTGKNGGPIQLKEAKTTLLAKLDRLASRAATPPPSDGSVRKGRG